MKIEKTENYKLLDKVLDAFADKDDTMCTFFLIGETGGSCGAGNPLLLTELFYNALKEGLKKGCKEDERNLSSALLSAITFLMGEDSKEGDIFRDIINSFTKGDESEEDDNDEDTSCKKCLDRVRDAAYKEGYREGYADAVDKTIQ